MEEIIHHAQQICRCLFNLNSIWSTHPLSFTYLRWGCGGSRLSRIFRTCLSPAMICSSSLWTLRPDAIYCPSAPSSPQQSGHCTNQPVHLLLHLPLTGEQQTWDTWTSPRATTQPQPTERNLEFSIREPWSQTWRYSSWLKQKTWFEFI